MERSSSLSIKESTGRGTEECEIRESSSAAKKRAAFPKSTPLFILMLVSLSISDNLRICVQKPSLATYKSQKMHETAKVNHISSEQEKKTDKKRLSKSHGISKPGNATNSHQFYLFILYQSRQGRKQIKITIS